MAFTHHFKPAHKEIKNYYEALAGYAGHQVAHEGATSVAFQSLLIATCKKADWHLVPQLATKIRGRQVRPDGTLRDDFNLHRGYWEAKDSGDKLDAEIRKKIALGYPPKLDHSPAKSLLLAARQTMGYHFSRGFAR